jgi:hypothetical protein
MLICFWSPKGGSGTSVITATAGLVLARGAPSRIIDLAGDQPAVLGLAHDPSPGLNDWLRAGAEAPTDALDHLTVEVGNNLTLLPSGIADAASDAAAPEAGAALAVALDTEGVTGVCDVGRLQTPALRAFAEVAGPNIVVVRGCYLALRRAVHHSALTETIGAVLVEEHARSLGAHDVEDVLGVPVLATVPARTSIARAVDAGVLTNRLPDGLARPVQHVLEQAGWCDGEQAA